MFRKALLTLMFTLPVWASPAAASVIIFDPAGTGGANAVAIDLLDPRPGNTIQINSGGATPQTPGQLTEGLFQANLSIADNSATAITEYTNGNLGHFFTFVAGIPEVISPLSSGSTIVFAQAGPTPAGPTATNYFYMYADTNGTNIVNGGVPNDRSGVCFTCGTLILSGVFINDLAYNHSFTVDVTTPPPGPPLDGFGTNNYPGVTTGVGTGAFTANILITGASGAYFPGLLAGTVVTWNTSTENVLPYKQVDPSACFSLNGLTPITSCLVPGAFIAAGGPRVGPINVEGLDVMAQSDSNLSFTTQAVIPEPTTMTLLGIGLLGAASRRRKQGKK